MGEVKMALGAMILPWVASYPWLKTVRVRRCVMADREHRKSWRQFMHVGHVHGTLTICYAKAADKLPWENIMGLLAHEIGHLAADEPGEKLADETAKNLFGWKILYDERNVEWMRAPRET
jgi:hypothetical protein